MTRAVVLAVAFALVIAGTASAHRTVSARRASTTATRYVQAHHCGHRLNFRCMSSSQLGYPRGAHSYRWYGSFLEARCIPWLTGCIYFGYEWHGTSGWINGHTGRVSGAREW